MPIANINQAGIYYELHGQGEPLILIAGYTCDHLFWSLILESLAKQFQVLIFDNRGIGRTKDNGADFKLETIADDVMALSNQLGLVKPNIVGHSMGGAIAQVIAKKYAEQISKIIILNSAAKFNERTIKAIEAFINLRQANVAKELLLDASLPWFFSPNFLASKSFTGFKKMLLDYPNPQTLANEIRQFHAIREFDSRGWLSSITAPTLVVSSEEDIADMPSEGEFIANNIKGARFVIIPGGHSSPVENPQVVSEVVVGFLKE